MKRPLVSFLVGPTASGKTELSLNIAKKLDCEILSADSRQIYKYMDIGTAKPYLEEQKQVPHHGIDLCTPDENYSAGQYGHYARRVTEEIISRKKIPLVVGGSGLYIRALVNGIFQGDFKSESLRIELKKEAQEKGLSVLYTRLFQIDPETASKIHPNDAKRIIRGLEVYMLSGIPISQWQKENTQPGNFRSLFFGLLWDRDRLIQRIHDRIYKMLEKGLIEETQRLLEMGYSPTQHNALDSVGYKEMIQYLQGEMTLTEAISKIQKNTRQFAKRQMTWFRKDPRIEWIKVPENPDWDKIANVIVKKIKENL